MSQFDRTRMHFLDALRGLAAFSVVIYHNTSDLRLEGALSGYSLQFAGLIVDHVDLGRYGVAVFFMISGFIIPTSLVSVNNDVGRFAVTRFFRLYPLYWLLLIPALIFPWTDVNATFSNATILANMTMAQGFLGRPDIIGVAWTLQVELVFYVCCAGLAIFAMLERPRTSGSICLGLLALSFALAIGRAVLHRKLPVALPLALGLMFFGTLWREATLTRAADAQRWLKLVKPILVVSIVPICFVGYGYDIGPDHAWSSYLACYMLAILTFTCFTTIVKVRWFPLVFLGQISYSLYLSHQLVESVLFHAGFRAISFPLHPVFYGLIVIAVSVAVGWALFVFVEKPFIRLGRSVVAWRASRRLSAAGPMNETLVPKG